MNEQDLGSNLGSAISLFRALGSEEPGFTCQACVTQSPRLVSACPKAPWNCTTVTLSAAPSLGSPTPPPPCHPPGGCPCRLPVTGAHPTVTVSASHPGFPGGLAGTESSCNEGNLGSIPGLGRFPRGGHGNPLQYSWASLVSQLVKTPSAMRETWV